MSTVKNYLSLIKFSHTIFAMPFALIGFFLGVLYVDHFTTVVPGWHTTIYIEPQILVKWDNEIIHLDWPLFTKKFLLVLLCMITARSAAMAFIVMGKIKTAETPLMQQHKAIKAKYPDAILLFRVGDFYETFGQDAVIASQVLGITLTKRNKENRPGG